MGLIATDGVMAPPCLDGADNRLPAIIHRDMLDADGLLPGLAAMSVQAIDQGRPRPAQPVRLIQALPPNLKLTAASRAAVAVHRQGMRTHELRSSHVRDHVLRPNPGHRLDRRPNTRQCIG